eukprot:jgi/Psemu1/19879/gm1.19879_g
MTKRNNQTEQKSRARQVFARLCKKVQMLREDPETGKNLEKMMLERFKSEKKTTGTVLKDGGTVASSLAEEENEDDNYIDPVLMELLGGMEEIPIFSAKCNKRMKELQAQDLNWFLHHFKTRFDAPVCAVNGHLVLTILAGCKQTNAVLKAKPGDPELRADVTGSIVAWPRPWINLRRVTWTTGDSFAFFIAHQPKYGPIEYVICQLLNHMKVNVTGELDLNQMEQQILVLAAAIGPFDAAFAHCGYSEDGVYPSVEIPINPNTNPPDWGPLGPPGVGKLAWAYV